MPRREPSVPTSRRVVLGAAAWSVPALTTTGAAPAYATSGAAGGGVFAVADGVASGDRRTFVVQSSGVSEPVTMTVTAVGRDMDTSPDTLPEHLVFGTGDGLHANFSTDAVIIRDTGAVGVCLAHHNTHPDPIHAFYQYRATYTFTFDRDVSALRFVIAGIEGSQGGYPQEGLSLSPPASRATAGSKVGATSDRDGSVFRLFGVGERTTPDDTSLQAVVEFDGPLRQLAITQEPIGGHASTGAKSTQDVFIGDISFIA